MVSYITHNNYNGMLLNKHKSMHQIYAMQCNNTIYNTCWCSPQHYAISVARRRTLSITEAPGTDSAIAWCNMAFSWLHKIDRLSVEITNSMFARYCCIIRQLNNYTNTRYPLHSINPHTSHNKPGTVTLALCVRTLNSVHPGPYYNLQEQWIIIHFNSAMHMLQDYIQTRTLPVHCLLSCWD